MRPTCLYCARKHLGQASALLGEARQGYPEHVWLAIGHLAEAADELVEKHPEMAAEIREHRKNLEVDPEAYGVPVVELIRKIGLLNRPGTMPSPEILKEPEARIGQAVAGCPPCEVARIKARREAAKQERQFIGEGKPYCGRLVIISPLTHFEPSYSHCSVILDQAHAARLVGYRVHVWVNVGCDLSKLPPMPAGLTVDGVLPQLPLHNDIIDSDNVRAISAALVDELAPLYDYEGGTGPRVITHDLVFQAGLIDYAVALHGLAEQGYGNKDNSKWWHLVHSSVGSRPPEHIARYRASLPAGHRIMAINYADVPFLRGYYQIPANEADRVVTLLNPRDPRSFFRMTPDASFLITRYGLLQKDVVQVYPLSGTRMVPKGVEKVIELFAAMAAAGAEVCLVVANAHSNNDETKHMIRHLKGFAQSLKLPAESLVFTSESLPHTEIAGLDGDSVRSLFSIANVFAFPTISEAGSLVLMEAMMSQCLLVLNDSLPCLADYVPRSLGIWVPWGSVKGVGRPINVDELAATVLDRLEGDERLMVRRTAFGNSSIEAYGERLHALIGQAVTAVGQGGDDRPVPAPALRG